MIRIVAPHFTAAIEPGGRSAPILRYMAGWSERRIFEYCKRKGWQAERLPVRTFIFDHLDAAPDDERRHFWRCARAVKAMPGWLVVRDDMVHPMRGEQAPVSGEIARTKWV